MRTIFLLPAVACNIFSLCVQWPTNCVLHCLFCASVQVLNVVGLRFIPYESHRCSKCNLNLDSLSYPSIDIADTYSTILFTNLAILLEHLTNILAIAVALCHWHSTSIAMQLHDFEQAGCGVYCGMSHEVYLWAVFAFNSVWTNKVDTQAFRGGAYDNFSRKVISTVSILEM